VRQADFDTWLGDAKKKFAAAPSAPAESGSGPVVVAAGK